MGCRPEVYPRFFSSDPQYHHHYGHGYQYGVTFLGNETLPVGTAYAIWTGIGAVGAAITGILLLGESASPARLLSLGLIVAGIIGLKLSAH